LFDRGFGLLDDGLEAIVIEGEEEFADEGAKFLFGDAGEDLGELLSGEVFEEVGEEGKLLGLGEFCESLGKRVRRRGVSGLVHWYEEIYERLIRQTRPYHKVLPKN
jgi:hypothetical protein